MTLRYKKKGELISSCIQNCEYIMLRAFINSKSIKCHAKCKDFCTRVEANNLILCEWHNSYPQHHKTFGNAHIGGNCKNYQVHIFIGSHWILTFLKILSPLVFMILIGLMNYKCHLKELEKQRYNGWSKSSNLATINKLDKTCTLRFVLPVMQ
jgi:hypothetical protein